MREDHQGHERNEERTLDPEETITSPTQPWQACSPRPRHHSITKFKTKF